MILVYVARRGPFGQYIPSLYVCTTYVGIFIRQSVSQGRMCVSQRPQADAWDRWMDEGQAGKTDVCIRLYAL